MPAIAHYTVKEIFTSLQGEGIQAGRKAVFLRFTGCNLWTGREADRNKAVCTFCDTDFVGGTTYQDAATLAQAVLQCWNGNGPGYVVITGGEPALQVDEALITALHDLDFKIAIETNGTLPLPDGLDWVCVSPKAGSTLVVHSGDELKVVYPQPGLDPASFDHLDFQHFLVQPMDGPHQPDAVRQAIDYCLRHPIWRLSLQIHKMIGLP